MKKIMAFILSTVILIYTFAFSSLALINTSDTPDINADSAILLNLNTGEILFDKNSDKRVYPASSVKIMTALLVIENTEDLDEVITVPEEAVKKKSGNSISLVPGENISIRQLLYALLLVTANDAANVLAYHISGSIDAFVQLMNEKAISLGATNTVYTNPTGLHDSNMVTTAYDTSLIAQAACYQSALVEIASTVTYTIEKTNKSQQRILYNKNLILLSNSNYYSKGVKGLNSGNTEQAGYNLVTMSTEKGMPLLCIVLSCDKTNDGTIHSYTDTKALYQWAFSGYEYKTILKAKYVNYEIPVKLSIKTDHVLLYPREDIELLLPTSINITQDIQKDYVFYSDCLYAPVIKDTVVGSIVLTYNGEVIATTDLLTSENIERSNLLYYMQIIEDATKAKWFKVSIVTFIVLLTVYIIISLLRRKKRYSDPYSHHNRL